MAEQLGTLKRCRSAHRMNVKKQLKDAQECIDNNSKDNAELLKLKVGLASKLEKIVKVDEQILTKLCQDDAIEEDTIAAESEEADDLATAVRTVLIKIESLLSKNKSPSVTVVETRRENASYGLEDLLQNNKTYSAAE